MDSLILELEIENVSKVRLVGHTDKHGSLEYNKQLSKRRVEQVEKYLLDYMNIQINTDYYGETQLKDLDTTKISDQNNRRVEVFYYFNCESNSNTDNQSVIYQTDPNCHIDTAATYQHYSNHLTGKNNSTVVVIDWTRSMYTYGTLLVKWFENNQDSASFGEIFIFNDGDGKPTHKKTLGDAGGIYNSEMTDLDTVVNLMEEVAARGTGGDYPENYIEALLEAQKSASNPDTIILIADNRACIRDYKLLDSLHLPVIVILNEIDPNSRIINYQYANLVAKNGGKIVFMNNSLDDIKFKNDQGHKPIHFKDTLIKMPKFRGDLDEAYEKIEQFKKERLGKSIPPILLINGEEVQLCYNDQIPTTTYKMGCAVCNGYGYDYTEKTYTKFRERFTFRQKIQRKWRNRPRARFKVIEYKWRKIKCKHKCSDIENKTEKSKCKREAKKCRKSRIACKSAKGKAKRKLKSYRKGRRKSAWKSFKKFFKPGGRSKKKSSKGSSPAPSQ